MTGETEMGASLALGSRARGLAPKENPPGDGAREGAEADRPLSLTGGEGGGGWPPPLSRRRVGIVGTAANTLPFAPWADEAWEFWAVGNNGDGLPRWDRWFDIHDPEAMALAGDPGWPSHWEWMRRQTKPIYMRSRHPEVPASVAYPKDEIVTRFAWGRRGLAVDGARVLVAQRPYFACSAAWMIALAIHLGAEEIGLWGIDMATASEYAHQKPSVAYWLGVCAGIGVKFRLPDESALLRITKLYGFEYPDTAEARLLMHGEELKTRLCGVQRQKAVIEANEQRLIGACDLMTYIREVWI